MKPGGPVPYLKPGQTIAGAVEILGDWMILTTNGNPSNVPMSVVAISQANSSKVTTLDPIPLEPGQQSTYYAHGAVDPENNRIYAMVRVLHSLADSNKYTFLCTGPAIILSPTFKGKQDVQFRSSRDPR